MGLKMGFKKTDVGVIPEDWEVSELGKFVSIGSGESPSKYSFSSSGIPYFKVEQLNHDSKYASITQYHFKSGRTVPAGSIIFPKRGASILLNKIRILREDSFMDTNLMTLTCLGELQSEYLYYFLSYTGLSKVADTTSIPQINNKHINPFKIPVPKSIEQTAIANALSDADALIGSLQKLIAKKRQIKQGAMQILLNPYENGVLKAGWICKRLRELAIYKNGKSFEKFISEEGNFFLITLNSVNIKGELKPHHLKINFTDNSLDKNDLIMVLSDVAHGNFLGLTAIIPQNNSYVLNQRMGALKEIKDIKIEYLRLYINHNQSYFKQCGKGSSQQNLGKDDILNFEVAIPSTATQDDISCALLDMEKEITALESKLAKYQQIKQGMMQNLLTGRIRLV